jgi:hypothetical protein
MGKIPKGGPQRALVDAQPSTPALIDLSPFCDQESLRYAIGAPRLVDGMACATDGKILIRCQPEKAMPFAPQDGSFPKLDDIMEGISRVSRWGRVEVAPCDVCQNAGVLITKCNCEGDCGEVRHEPCECSGTHRVGEFPLRPRHAYLVDALPGAVWQLDEPASRVLYFRFAHGDGAVTPAP